MGEHEHDTPEASTVPEGQNAGAVTVEVFSDPAHEALIARADFLPLQDAYEAHLDRWGIESDPPGRLLMRRGLAAATLHMACRPRDELDAITINFTNPPLNMFFAGDNFASVITGRLFVRDVKTSDRNRIFLEAHSPPLEPVRSVVEIDGRDPLEIFEQYYQQAEQTRARLFSLSDTEFAMVVGLSSTDRAWLKGLTPAWIRSVPRPGQVAISAFTYHFECGCSAQKIMAALRQMFAKDPDELFGQDERIEVMCPRCGRRWWILEEDFIKGEAGVGYS